MFFEKLMVKGVTDEEQKMEKSQESKAHMVEREKLSPCLFLFILALLPLKSSSTSIVKIFRSIVVFCMG